MSNWRPVPLLVGFLPIPRFVKDIGTGALKGAADKALQPIKEELSDAAAEAGAREAKKLIGILAVGGALIITTAAIVSRRS